MREEEERYLLEVGGRSAQKAPRTLGWALQAPRAFIDVAATRRLLQS